MNGCDIVVRSAELTVEEERMGIGFSVALKGRGVKKCRMSDVFVSYEVPYFSATERERQYITRIFCCMWVEFLCDSGGLRFLLKSY